MDKYIEIKYENIKYIIWFSKTNEIFCQKTIDNKHTLNLDDDDKKTIKNVINSLCISKEKSHFVKSDTLNGINYNLYYDNEKLLYFTDTLNEEINTYVNLKFNNLQEVFTSINNKEIENSYTKGKNHKFKRKLKDKLVYYTVFASINLMLLSIGIKENNNTNIKDIFTSYNASKLLDLINEQEISGKISFSELNNKNLYLTQTKTNNELTAIDITTGEKKLGNLTFETIKKNLNNNDAVDDEFKSFFNKLDFALEDNIKYFDESILNKIKTLKVEYDADSQDGAYVNGRYYPIENKIIYYNAHNFDEVDPNTALHELGHVFQNVNTNNICFELSNEIWTRETLRKMIDKKLISDELFKKNECGNIIYVDGYTDKLFLYYYLMELMSTDSIKNFQWNPNDSILVSSLAESSNRNEIRLAHEIIQLINNCKEVGYITQENNLVIELKEKLNYFYNKNKNINIDDDMNILAFDIPVNINDSEINMRLIGTDNYNIDYENIQYYGQPKSYFSDGYKATLFYQAYINNSDNRVYSKIQIDSEPEHIKENNGNLKK